MTTQITVRIDDELAAFVDAEVSAGRTRSRASFIEGALRRERRRLAGERDAAIYTAVQPGGDDLDGVAVVARRVDVSDLD